VTSGLALGDVIVVSRKNGSYAADDKSDNNPFMPKWRRKR
jgi:hypothetical protein